MGFKILSIQGAKKPSIQVQLLKNDSNSEF